MKLKNTALTLLMLAQSFTPLLAATKDTLSDVDKAGNKLKNMSVAPQGSPEASVQGCTSDKEFCSELIYQKDSSLPILKITQIHGKESNVSFELKELTSELMNTTLTLWPRMLYLADTTQGMMIGIEEDSHTMYSGGGANSSILHLFHLYPKNNEMNIRETLTVSTYGSALIRACFSERDYKQRRGACHDEYEFKSQFHLDKRVDAGFPKLIFQTHATSFPGPVSRLTDSLASLPLKKKDLVKVVDPECTFRRIFSFDLATGVYIPNKELPTCENYTVP
ncbi:hypothetical protein [Chromobacterium phragmitis]|uniref:hypothetical protein n=1 Tax=Chromobacterium phragmitis TaxID=2202141 RepID=UPI0011AE183A|nr:hypothetical protein [Chromobacterium phragmitis]